MYFYVYIHLKVNIVNLVIESNSLFGSLSRPKSIHPNQLFSLQRM